MGRSLPQSAFVAGPRRRVLAAHLAIATVDRLERRRLQEKGFKKPDF
jgi:hypothetical protein